MAEATQDKDWVRIGLLGFFWLLALSAFLFGLGFFAYALSQWLDDGGQFLGLDGFFDALIGLIGAGLMSGGLLAAGVLLRFSRFSFAPKASLVVAILATLLVLATYWLFAGIFGPDDTGQKALLMVAAVVSLVVLAVPPFLHWRRSQGSTGVSP